MVKKRSRVPVRGGVYFVNLDPTRGYEERGSRPVIVVSPESYNRKSGLVLCCPITSQRKGYPFEVECMIKGKPGAILSDQVRALDWKARKFTFVEILDPSTVEEVQAKLLALIAR